MMRAIAGVPLCAMLAACGSSTPPPAAPAAAAAPPFHTTLNMKQLMSWIIDPNAMALWNSVGTIVTDTGTEDRKPKTDEEWGALRNAAAVLVESSNVLMLDGRAVDKGEWMSTARGMADAAATVLEAAEAKDVDAFFDAGGALYDACTACHSKYLIGPQPTK